MKDKEAIMFDLPADHAQAIDKLAAGRKVRFSGRVHNGKLVVDNIGFAEKEFNTAVFAPVNAPFTHV
jgi:hypothetical protein